MGITDKKNMAYSLLAGCFNAFTSLFPLLGFLSGTLSVISSSKSILETKYDFKEFHCINVLSKHFPRLNLLSAHDELFFNFVIAKVQELPWLFLFCFTILRQWWNMSIPKSSTLTEISLDPFPAHKGPKWHGNQRQKSLLHCPTIELVLS